MGPAISRARSESVIRLTRIIDSPTSWKAGMGRRPLKRLHSEAVAASVPAVVADRSAAVLPERRARF